MLCFRFRESELVYHQSFIKDVLVPEALIQYALTENPDVLRYGVVRTMLLIDDIPMFSYIDVLTDDGKITPIMIAHFVFNKCEIICLT